MVGPAPESIAEAAAPLGWFYLVAAAANVAAAWRARRATAGLPSSADGTVGQAGHRAKHGHGTRRWKTAALSLAAAVFALLAAFALAGRAASLPETVKSILDRAVTPMGVWLAALALAAVLFWGRRLVAAPAVAWTALNASLLLLGLSLADRQLAAVALAPDNVPILGMVYLLGFFLWLAVAQAVENDRRLAAGLPPREQADAQRTLAWPDLVYIELIAMVSISALLVVWSVWVRAPLEQPANAALTPNPAKAPWYFLGLQELLVFSDAWLVGVIVPCAAVLGLMAIPYLDFNPQGNGYYTIRQRRFAVAVFLFGFLMLWIVPILVGVFLRGPNWSAFGPYEVRDPGKLSPAHQATLAEWFWSGLLRRGLPQVPAGGLAARLGAIAGREAAGLVVLAAYFLALPPLLGRTLLAGFRRRMGRGRYALMVLLLLVALLLPLKMLLQWCFGLNYLLSIPEWSLNF
jgi:hypothetical protein